MQRTYKTPQAEALLPRGESVATFCPRKIQDKSNKDSKAPLKKAPRDFSRGFFCFFKK